MLHRSTVAAVLVSAVAAAPCGAAADGSKPITPITREVRYSSRSIVAVNAKLRFSTMLILPDTEEILDFVCGDKEFWIVSGGQNLAYVKPAKAGAMTNLNLVTASGTVYSFLLTEGAGDPDLKVYVTPDDELTSIEATTKKRFYTAEQMAAAQQAADDARHDADAAKTNVTRLVDERIAQFRATYPGQLQFPFRFKANEAPFHVAAIYTDGTFTYIRANATELPSLYEVRDESPNLINFQVENGLYIVPKVLTRGYLVIGKRRLLFDRVP